MEGVGSDLWQAALVDPGRERGEEKDAGKEMERTPLATWPTEDRVWDGETCCRTETCCCSTCFVVCRHGHQQVLLFESMIVEQGHVDCKRSH